MEWRGGSRRSEVISKRYTRGRETNGASGLREKTVRDVAGEAEKLRLRKRAHALLSQQRLQQGSF